MISLKNLWKNFSR